MERSRSLNEIDEATNSARDRAAFEEWQNRYQTRGLSFGWGGSNWSWNWLRPIDDCCPYPDLVRDLLRRIGPKLAGLDVNLRPLRMYKPYSSEALERNPEVWLLRDPRDDFPDRYFLASLGNTKGRKLTTHFGERLTWAEKRHIREVNDRIRHDGRIGRLVHFHLPNDDEPTLVIVGDDLYGTSFSNWHTRQEFAESVAGW
jgi:hypothetical protein